MQRDGEETNKMIKELEKLVSILCNSIKDFDKLSRRHKREVKRKLLRREYKKLGIKHSGNFSPTKPFKYKGSE